MEGSSPPESPSGSPVDQDHKPELYHSEPLAADAEPEGTEATKGQERMSWLLVNQINLHFQTKSHTLALTVGIFCVTIVYLHTKPHRVKKVQYRLCSYICCHGDMPFSGMCSLFWRARPHCVASDWRSADTRLTCLLVHLSMFISHDNKQLAARLWASTTISTAVFTKLTLPIWTC